MIRKIKAENFKSLKSVELYPKGLNLFTGINSSGKSTFLQSLLLISQSIYKDSNISNSAGLFLGDRSSWVSLGTFNDVINQNAEKNEILSISIDEEQTSITFISELYSPENKEMITIPGNFKIQGDFTSSLISQRRIEYLASERIVPQDDFPRLASKDQKLGKDGRFTPHFLVLNGNKDIKIPILIEGMPNVSDSYTLNSLITLWMNELSPNIQFKTKENLQTNRIELSYTYKLGSRGLVPSQDRKTQNVGFGITHTLPVLVALLSAVPGDILIIENPETHLHPKGQSKLGMLLSLVAERGVQIFVETHSDHILNGVRVAAKRHYITPHNISIQFFKQDAETGNSEINVLNVDENGRLNKWPKYFFDEWGNMLDELL